MMETKGFIYYEEDGLFVGWLEEYPDYRTQGKTMGQLQDNLLDLYRELASEDDWRAVQETLHLVSIPGMRESIHEGMATPVDELEDKGDW